MSWHMSSIFSSASMPMSSSFSCSPGLSLAEELVVCDSLSRLMIFSYTCSITFLTCSMSLADRRSLGEGGRGESTHPRSGLSLKSFGPLVQETRLCVVKEA